MKNVSCLTLFPHDPNSLLINQDMKLKALKLSLFLINQCINAIDSFFIKKTYADFDAHVGDTLCQIRAYKLLLLIEYFRKNPAEDYHVEELKKLHSIKQIAEEKIALFSGLIKNKQARYNKTLDKSEPLYEFTKEHDLDFEITETTQYLTQSIILMRYSKRISFGVSIAMEYEKFMDSIDAGHTTIRKLIKNFQSTLAQQSCEFIYSLCREIPDQSRLNEILPKLETVDAHKRKVLPCYEATKIILLHMRTSQIPILLVTHKQKNNLTAPPKPFLFIFSKEKNEFELIQTIASETPCLIIHGSTQSDSIDSIIKVGLITVILSNMATHPQLYTKTSEIIKEREPEVVKMQRLAESSGYCQENPMLFFLKHIYSDSLKNELIRINHCNPIQSYSLTA